MKPNSKNDLCHYDLFNILIFGEKMLETFSLFFLQQSKKNNNPFCYEKITENILSKSIFIKNILNKYCRRSSLLK